MSRNSPVQLVERVLAQCVDNVSPKAADQRARKNALDLQPDVPVGGWLVAIVAGRSPEELLSALSRCEMEGPDYGMHKLERGRTSVFFYEQLEPGKHGLLARFTQQPTS